MPSQGHSGGNKVDHSLLGNAEDSAQWEWVLLPRWFFSWSAFYSPIRIGGRRKGYERKKTNRTLHSPWIPSTDSQEDEQYDVTKPRKAPYKTKCKVYQDAVYGIFFFEKKTQENELRYIGSCLPECYSGKLDPMLLSFMSPYQPTVLNKWWIPRTEEILYQNSFLMTTGSTTNKLFWRMLSKFKTKIVINVEPVQEDLWRTRQRWNLKLTSEPKVFLMLQSSKKKKTIEYDWLED